MPRPAKMKPNQREARAFLLTAPPVVATGNGGRMKLSYELHSGVQSPKQGEPCRQCFKIATAIARGMAGVIRTDLTPRASPQWTEA